MAISERGQRAGEGDIAADAGGLQVEPRIRVRVVLVNAVDCRHPNTHSGEQPCISKPSLD